MWSASSATREPRHPILGGEPRAGVPRQLARTCRLAAEVARIWAHAVLVAGRMERDREFDLRRRCARRLTSSLGLEVSVVGDPPPYDEPVLLVANHVSWVDPYVLNCASGARFVAKSEVANWPFIGVSARRFGTFFIRRGSCRSASRVKDELARALRSRDPVGVFPEATTTDGSALRRFYPAMFQAAIDARAMVQPVALRYLPASGRPPDSPAFIGEMTLADSLRRMLPVRTIVAELTFCPPLYARGRTRRELAARAQESIGAALRPPTPEDLDASVDLEPPARRAA